MQKQPNISKSEKRHMKKVTFDVATNANTIEKVGEINSSFAYESKSRQRFKIHYHSNSTESSNFSHSSSAILNSMFAAH